MKELNDSSVLATPSDAKYLDAYAKTVKSLPQNWGNWFLGFVEGMSTKFRICENATSYVASPKMVEKFLA